MFNKSKELFPIKDECIYLSHCGISPLFSRALDKEIEIAGMHSKQTVKLFDQYVKTLTDLRTAAASLLKTSPDHLAFVKNTSEGMSMIANGYRFQKGDQIISYVYDYPANYYPWKLQERRGVELRLLPDRIIDPEPPGCIAQGWSMADLESLVTKKTRIIAISHVLFTSGFAADLKQMGEFCKQHGIDLVVDAAQSLGALPLYPDDYNIAAIVSSGWKWLMGPLGTGLMYTSEEFRAKLTDVVVGAELMLQAQDYLNHSWHPHHTAKRFEYSTSPLPLAEALNVCIRELFLNHSPESIRGEIHRLHDIALASIDRERYIPLWFPESHRGSILSVVCTKNDPKDVSGQLMKQGVVCTGRGGYLRIAPHFYNTDDEIRAAIAKLNAIET